MEFFLYSLLVISCVLLVIYFFRKKPKITDVHDTGDQVGLTSGEYFTESEDSKNKD